MGYSIKYNDMCKVKYNKVLLCLMLYRMHKTDKNYNAFMDAVNNYNLCFYPSLTVIYTDNTIQIR